MMKMHLRRVFFIASIFAAATAGVFAQTTAPKEVATTPSPGTPSPTSPAATTQAQRDFEAAKAACTTERTTNALNECLRRADDAYNKATGLSGAPVGGANGQAGSGTNSARQRS